MRKSLPFLLFVFLVGNCFAAEDTGLFSTEVSEAPKNLCGLWTLCAFDKDGEIVLVNNSATTLEIKKNELIFKTYSPDNKVKLNKKLLIVNVLKVLNRENGFVFCQFSLKISENEPKTLFFSLRENLLMMIDKEKNVNITFRKMKGN